MIQFSELGLEDVLLKGIEKLGFVEPMPVQEQVIPFMLAENGDLVALAQTGTGKTAAFGLPLLQTIDSAKGEIQSVILCPTRELCMQIHKDLTAYGRYKKNLRVVAVYGGASIDGQIRDLEKRPQIVVATPGRLLDMIRRKKVNFGNLQNLILDEADEMLNMGFAEELNAILEETPTEKRVALFSATMPVDVARIARKYMRDPQEIVVGTRNAMADQVSHQVFFATSSDRFSVVRRIIDFYPEIYGILFCRTRQEAKDMAEKLWKDGYNADALHGDLSQAQRDTVMGRFRAKQVALLVATDVAARGLDVSNLTHVIHLNLPQDANGYTHRSGRTGRAGKSGMSVLIASPADRFKMQRIEKYIGVRFEYPPIPDGRAVSEKKVMAHLDRLDGAVGNMNQIEPFMDIIMKRFASLSREDILQRWLSLELGELLAHYQTAPDLNRNSTAAKAESKGKRREKSGFSEQDFSKLRVNMGKRDQLSPMVLMGMVSDATGKRNIEIGRIEIFRTYSLFEVDRHEEKRVLEAFTQSRIKGTDVKVTRVSGDQPEEKKVRYEKALPPKGRKSYSLSA